MWLFIFHFSIQSGSYYSLFHRYQNMQLRIYSFFLGEFRTQVDIFTWLYLKRSLLSVTSHSSNLALTIMPFRSEFTEDIYCPSSNLPDISNYAIIIIHHLHNALKYLLPFKWLLSNRKLLLLSWHQLLSFVSIRGKA